MIRNSKTVHIIKMIKRENVMLSDNKNNSITFQVIVKVEFDSLNL